MLVNFGKAALLAAIVTLTGNVVWAQDRYYIEPVLHCSKEKCEAAKGCCATGSCCKESKCGTCCKEAKCACCKEGQCCTAADKKCKCGEGEKCCCGKTCDCSKTCACAKEKGCCCAISGGEKRNVIFVVLPTMPPIPLMATYRCAEPAAMPPPPMFTPPGLPVPPVMPPQTVGMPVPPPPPPGCYSYTCPRAAAPICQPATPATAYPCPTAIPEGVPSKINNDSLDYCLSMLGMGCEICSFARSCDLPSLCLAVAGIMSDVSPSTNVPASAPCCDEILPPPTPESAPCCTQGLISGLTPCITCASKDEEKHWVVASSDSPRLETTNGNGNACSFKRATIKIGDDEITISRFDDRVRVRGDELKATAERIRINRDHCLILEGDVVLHYKKDDQSAHVSAEHIELNLATGAMTIKGTINLPTP
jgi:hypothetical protein